MKAAPIFKHVWVCVNARIPVSVPLFVPRAGGKLHSHTTLHHFLIVCYSTGGQQANTLKWRKCSVKAERGGFSGLGCMSS